MTKRSWLKWGLIFLTIPVAAGAGYVGARMTSGPVEDRVDGLLLSGMADDKLFAYLLAEKTDQLVTGLATDREKAMAIAEWIGTH